MSAVLSAADDLDLKRDTPAQGNAPIPVADFFRPPIFIEPELNRAGTHIAALVTSGEDKYQLLVTELKTKSVETLQLDKDRDIVAFHWLGNKRLIFVVSAEKRYGVLLLAADVGDLREAYPLLQFCGTRIVSVPPKDPLHPLVWLSYELAESGHGNDDGGVVTVNTSIKTGRIFDLMRADTDWDQVKQVMDENHKYITTRYPMPEGGLAYGYLADKEGNLALGFTLEDGRPVLHHFNDGKWKKCPVDLEHVGVFGFGKKKGEIIVTAPKKANAPWALQMMDAESGQFGDELLQDDAYDLDGWLYKESVSHEVVGAFYNRAIPSVVWFDPGYKELQEKLNKAFPGLVAHIIGSDEKGERFLVQTFSDRQPGIYYTFDLATRVVGLIKNSRPWIDPARMCPTKIFKFKTRDGHALDAYLTLPAGASKDHPVPMVVLAHGGPWTRDTWGFDGEVQFLTSRGYAVLQPNYRGSTGYNWMFPDEDKWAFRKMHDDVTDATKTALKSGLIEPNRVAIMGSSFGGYLSISGVAHEPELYRCAVTVAGVFDWEQMLKDAKWDEFDDPNYARLKFKLGDPKTFKGKFAEISPINFVNNIHVPVFVAHGKGDQVVSVTQSKKLISELKKNGIPCETMMVNREGHGMHHLGNEVDLYTKIEAFLAKNMPPNQPLSAAP